MVSRLVVRLGLLLVALGGAALLPAPAAAGRKPTKLSFTVSIPPGALRLETETLATQATITRVSLDDTAGVAARDEVVGFPRLPYLVELVALPRGAKDVEVAIALRGEAIVGQVPLVEWAQLAQPSGDPAVVAPAHWPAPPAEPLDASVASLARWPADDGGLLELSDAAGYRLARVRVNPVRWIPATGDLWLAGEVEVTVQWTGGRAPRAPRRYAPWSEARTLEQVVVNPGDVVVSEVPPGLRRNDWPYLILTDDTRWQASPPVPGAPEPGMVEEFQRLADWRTANGLRGRVVTIASIVDGEYGDFSAGAADLQEILRRFLQWANRRWSTAWVVLGGDVGIVPARTAFGFGGECASAYHPQTASEAPPLRRTFWHAANSTVRLQHEDAIAPATTLVSLKSGRALRRVTAPSEANPGWAYAADDGYASESPSPTRFVVIRGPAADVGSIGVAAVLDESSIPADLYYAALHPAGPGLRDWDANANGIYGQYGFDGTQDGVNYWPVVNVGRVPADSSDAVLEDGEFVHVAGETSALLQFGSPPGGPAAHWRLLAREGGGTTPIPYAFPAFSGSRSFFFCSSLGCTAPAVGVAPLGGSSVVPLPRKNVRVSGPAAELDPQAFVFDRIGADDSLTEKEAIRSLWAGSLPGLVAPRRLYEDLLDTPGYPATGLGAISEAAMHVELDAGYNAVSLSGHGLANGCCGVDRSWASMLTNGGAGGVVYAESCLTARFDDEDALGETMVCSPFGGAVAYVGNSRFGWIGVGPLHERRFWRMLATDARVGRALAVARVMQTADVYQRWGNASLNLIGDPATPMWRGEPGLLAAVVPSLLVPRQALVVQAQGAQGAQGAIRVTVTGPRGLFASQTVDPKLGAVSFKLRVEAGDLLRVVVTADDAVPVEVEVPVVAS